MIHKYSRTFLAIGIYILLFLFVGVLEIQGETGVTREVFIKAYPTTQFVFNNPYESAPFGEEHEYSKRMDEHGDWLPGTNEMVEYMNYCKHRHGIKGDNQLEVRERCKAHEATPRPPIDR